MRAAGILLHPTSLPRPEDAHAFVDWLAGAGMTWWQMLPVGPPGYGESPYSAHSAFAGSARLLPRPIAPPEPDDPAFLRFCAENAGWLPDWSLYAAIKETQGGAAWVRWPAPLRAREPAALAEARRTLAAEVTRHEWVQWRFEQHWAALRAHAQACGISLLGDVPIFMAHDSADVWAHPDLFSLGPDGMPTHVAGVPPDYFSATGQRWGNPLYRWSVHADRGFDWWIARMQLTLRRFDAVRLDHFIGFQRYWEIPAAFPTAMEGTWRAGPGDALFLALKHALGERLPLVAEDLGSVTPEVTALRDRFDLPGIRLLQFAFGSDPQAPTFKPHAYPRHAVVYTGTHDNNTTAGWWADEATPAERDAARAYLGPGEEIHWAFIRAVMASVADLAIVPMQDPLGLGSDARMNTPGTDRGNWRWQLSAIPDSALQARLRGMCEAYDR